MIVSTFQLENSGFVKDTIFFNLLECMNVDVNEKDWFMIKKDCLNQVGQLKYNKALDLLKFEEANPS